jgi:hypothetical protein
MLLGQSPFKPFRGEGAGGMFLAVCDAGHSFRAAEMRCYLAAIGTRPATMIAG